VSQVSCGSTKRESSTRRLHALTPEHKSQLMLSLNELAGGDGEAKHSNAQHQPHSHTVAWVGTAKRSTVTRSTSHIHIAWVGTAKRSTVTRSTSHINIAWVGTAKRSTATRSTSHIHIAWVGTAKRSTATRSTSHINIACGWGRRSELQQHDQTVGTRSLVGWLVHQLTHAASPLGTTVAVADGSEALHIFIRCLNAPGAMTVRRREVARRPVATLPQRQLERTPH
jgi:hypothetical protein